MVNHTLFNQILGTRTWWHSWNLKKADRQQIGEVLPHKAQSEVMKPVT